MNTLSKRPCLYFAMMAIVALSGCGGGGGNSGDGMMLANMLTDNIGANSQASARTQAQQAAASTPLLSGTSVTQSSVRDTGSGVTRDDVTATASYTSGTLSMSVTNRRSGSWGTVDSDDIVITSNTLTGNNNTIVEQRELGKQTDNNQGAVIVDVFTTRDRANADATDYLVGGVWVYAPDLDSPTGAGVEIGAFIDRPDDNLTGAGYLQTSSTATYQAGGGGLYLGTDTDGSAVAGEFVAAVSLTATFGSTPTVSGSVTNFQTIDNPARTMFTPIANNPTLTLDRASIAREAGGFFTGDTSGTFVVDGIDRMPTGKWGGQFYGAEANRVSGTFSGSIDESLGNDDADLTIIGIFEGIKQ